MTYELRHNGVITGSVNCFCLACDTFLQNREDAVCHTKTSSHRENLSAIPYLEKFNDQYIKKFKSGYFCQFCNKLIQTAMHVNLHIAEDQHQQKRGTKLLKSSSNVVIAFNNVLIHEDAWHGLIDYVCCICVTEFENDALHKADTSHSLGLIRTPIKFDVNDAIYRHIDDTNIQCITCNKLIPTNTMSKHFNDIEHIDIYEKCKIAANIELERAAKQDNTENVAKINKLKKEDSKTDKPILPVVSNPNQDKKYNSDVIKELNVNVQTDNHIKSPLSKKPSKPNVLNEQMAAVKKQNKNPDVVPEDSKKNTRNNNKDSNIKTDDSNAANNDNKLCTTDELERYAADNKINIQLNDNQAYCNICKVNIPPTLNCIKVHVNGGRHNKNVLASLTRQTMDKFVFNLLRVQGLSSKEIDSGYLINDKYYISLQSHLLLLKNNPGLGMKCLICEINLPPQPEVPVAHIDACSLPKGRNIAMITSKEDEYIREIRPGSFHCGFCHVLVTGWSEMESHLLTSEHGRHKSFSFLRYIDVSKRIN